MNRNQIRRIKDLLFRITISVFCIVSVLPLFFVFGFIFHKGISAISPEFFTNLPAPVGETGGGIVNAMVGTLILILTSSLIALPIGISAGIYLAEYPKNKISRLLGTSVDILQGIPSIVIGILAYVWVVKPMGHFSAFSGGIALAMMMLPVVIRSTEETLKLLPSSLKEASLALGASYSTTLMKVVVPAGLSGIVTGALLSIARIAGETAPLLFTAFGNPFMNWNPMEPVHSLPLLIFNYAISPYEEWHQLAWGAALVLLMMLFFLNLLSRFLTRKWRWF